jgi:[ribosomal protein S18]-alanine N-acetyltransferase
MREYPIEPLHFVHLSELELDELLLIEQSVYSKPWTRGNFLDAIKNNNWCHLLINGTTLTGYFVAMMGFQEVHLLNFTVAKPFQNKGYGLHMLESLALMSKTVSAQWIWLEVRVSNERAFKVYEAFGFKKVGERKNYYPLSSHQREDAIIMSYRL